jgi:hypothetical protein
MKVRGRKAHRAGSNFSIRKFVVSYKENNFSLLKVGGFL